LANGSVTAPSFEFYEGIRILLPGGFVVALYSGVVATFGLSAPNVGGDALAGFTAALFIGIFLLFLDVPAKSAAYRYRLPNRELDTWDVEPPAGTTTANVYFVLLDEAVPKGVADRALYTGSIFRIGYEAIYFAFLTATAVVAFGLFTAGHGPQRESGDAVEVTLFVGAALHACLPLLAVIFGYFRLGRRGTSASWKRVLDGVRDGVPLPDRILLVGAAAGAIWYLNEGGILTGIVAIAIPLALWAFRYHRGHRPRDRTIPAWALIRRFRAYWERRNELPRNPRPPEAVFTLAWSGGTAYILAAFDLPAQSALDLTAVVGWLTASLFAGVLVIAHGHERKLHASYHTQSTWLKLHRDELVRRYFEASPQSGNHGVEGAAPGTSSETWTGRLIEHIRTRLTPSER
jgi:hypothetical protein